MYTDLRTQVDFQISKSTAVAKTAILRRYWIKALIPIKAPASSVFWWGGFLLRCHKMSFSQFSKFCRGRKEVAALNRKWIYSE